MGPKPAEKKTKAEIKAEEAAEAERLAAAAEAERVKLEAIRAEKFVADQTARGELMDECRQDLAEQEDREDNENWHRTSERQKQLDKEAEIAEWHAFLKPSHLPAVDNEADLNSYISEIQVPIYADDPMTEAVVQAMPCL